MTYWEEVRARAKALGADGCSGPAIEWYRDCCLEHDVHYRTGRRLDGTAISRREADAVFRRCMQERSPLKKWSPLAAWRWVAVRLFGGHHYQGQESIHGSSDQ